MRVDSHDTKRVTNNENPELKFEIDSLHPEILIKIVSDMYPNPRRTLITEYVQNGYDSHVEAEKPDVPLLITLPTEAVPEFKVRDYGVGMTEKDIDETFRKVAKSTKSGNSNLLGGFGIGKLVFGPYCGVMYMDLYDGEKRINYLFRLKDGFAGAQKQYEEASDEPKGVCVTIPVFSRDVSYFQSVAPFQYGFMACQPTIEGKKDYFKDINTWLSESVLVESEDGKDRIFSTVIDEVKSHSGDNPQALIGGLPFDIRMSSVLENIEEDSPKGKIVKMFRDQFFTLSFGPNEVEIVPSRDNLKYSSKTCAAITNRILALHKALLKHVEQLTSTAKNLPEMYEACEDLIRTGLITEEMVAGLEWKGQRGWFPAIKTLLKSYQGDNGYYRQYTRFSSPPSSVPTKYDRVTVDPSEWVTKKVEDEILTGLSNGPILNAASWLLQQVESVRMKRSKRYSHHTTTDITLQRVNDVRSSLLPMVVPFSKVDKGVTHIVAVPLEEINKVDGNRRINHHISAPQSGEDLTDKLEHLVIMYLEKGVSFDDLEAKLKEAELLNDGLFIRNVMDLPKPPKVAQTRTGGKKKSGLPGDNEFGTNNIFEFDCNGSSPSNRFNGSFWGAITDPQESIDKWKSDGDILLKINVSSYSPKLQDEKDRPRFDAGLFDVDQFRRRVLEDSGVLAGFIAALEVQTKKTVRLIGVKPTKYSKVKLLDLVDYVYKEQLLPTYQAVSKITKLTEKDLVELAGAKPFLVMKGMIDQIKGTDHFVRECSAVSELKQQLESITKGVITRKTKNEAITDAMLEKLDWIRSLSFTCRIQSCPKLKTLLKANESIITIQNASTSYTCLDREEGPARTQGILNKAIFDEASRWIRAVADERSGAAILGEHYVTEFYKGMENEDLAKKIVKYWTEQLESQFNSGELYKTVEKVWTQALDTAISNVKQVESKLPEYFASIVEFLNAAEELPNPGNYLAGRSSKIPGANMMCELVAATMLLFILCANRGSTCPNTDGDDPEDLYHLIYQEFGNCYIFDRQANWLGFTMKMASPTLGDQKPTKTGASTTAFFLLNALHSAMVASKLPGLKSIAGNTIKSLTYS
jgi:hypothetical protein